jgi:hypothetical protein
MSDDPAPATPENLVSLLDKLVYPPEPLAVSLVPQTTGWLVLLVCGLVGIAFLARILVIRHRANAYRRAALAALKTVDGDPAGLARIVRKTALEAFPRVEVASLYGKDWLAFLDDTCDGAEFVDGPGQFVARAPYRRAEPVSEAGIDAVRYWITNHRRGVAS